MANVFQLTTENEQNTVNLASASGKLLSQKE